MEALVNELAQLPAPQTAATKPNVNSTLHVVSAKRVLPASRLTKMGPDGQFRQVVETAPSSRALVLDYQMVHGSFTNYTFQGDTTYYISGTVNLSGTNTFEGGTVIKYAGGASINLVPASHPGLNWQASAYRPVIFTARDDNSVGEPFGSGNPSGYYANPALELININPTLAYFRIAYAAQGLFAVSGTFNLNHGQIINCQCGIGGTYAAVAVKNMLFANVATNFNSTGGLNLNVQNATFNQSACLLNTVGDNGPTFTNCIFANVANLLSGYLTTFSGDYNGFYNSQEFGFDQRTNNFYPFQSVGAGNYYLASGCNFTNQGTTNIDATLLAALKTRTTYPPIVYSNATISLPTTFNPQAQRDTDTPDLGYHYDPIDYVLGGVYVTNATVTVNPGTVIATFGTKNIAYGLGIGSGAQFFCQGLANNLNRIVQYNTVQEQAITNWSRVLAGSIESEFLNVSPAATIICRFTDWSMPAQDAPHLNGTNGICNPINLQDCQFHGGKLVSSYPTFNLTNCLFERVNASLWSADSNSPSLRNNLFWRGTFNFAPNVTNALVKDNLFDQTSISNNSGYVTYNGGFNAFVTNYNRLQPTFTNDVILTNSPVYQSSWLGNYYLPTNSPLINAGSTNANLVGLYHYTTQTNQVKETNSVVDIGYHYVATDTNGIPVDTNGDGIPDYLEDANGNGVVDGGESNWGLAILAQPTNQTVVQGSNATFSVTAAGMSPLHYQWYSNSAAINGATYATLTLNNVQTNYSGNYFVVVTNVLGSVTSATVALTVITYPVIIQSPAGQTAFVGDTVQLSATAIGVLPLNYQWQMNGVNINGATNSTLTLPIVQLIQSGNYSVVVSNSYGATNSFMAALRVWQPGIVKKVASSQWDTIQTITNLSNVVAITSGNMNGTNLALKVDGTVVAWSVNLANTNLNLSADIINTGLSNVVAIAEGYYYYDYPISCYALKADGTVVYSSWGLEPDDWADMGYQNVIAMSANGWNFQPLFNDGTTGFYMSDGAYLNPTGVVAVACSVDAYLVQKQNGTLQAWGGSPDWYGQGTDVYGETAIPAALTNTPGAVIGIAAGNYHFMAIKSNRTVVAWGDNDSGQCNVPASLTNVIRLAAGVGGSTGSGANNTLHYYADSLALKTDGTLVKWVSNGGNFPPAGSNYVDMAGNAATPGVPYSDGYFPYEDWAIYGAPSNNGTALEPNGLLRIVGYAARGGGGGLSGSELPMAEEWRQFDRRREHFGGHQCHLESGFNLIS